MAFLATLLGGDVTDFALLIGSEKASPWKETDKLLVEVINIFVAADISLLTFACGFGVVGREEVIGLLLSTDWDLLDPETNELGVVGVCKGPEFVDLESNGEGNLLETEELEEEEVEVVVVVVVVVVEVEGEGERYLEGTCLPLGFLEAMRVVPPPLFRCCCCWSFSEGKSGGLVTRLGVLSVEVLAA